MFDLAIFDEASQCDIASALPIFARAKCAVVVGDNRQLSFISQLGIAHNRNLMQAQDLPISKMGRFAQSRRSLFDLADLIPVLDVFYKRNLTPIPEKQSDGSESVKARFAPLETVAIKPNIALAAVAELMDLAWAITMKGSVLIPNPPQRKHRSKRARQLQSANTKRA
ncbi:hypothetical protein [Rhizobium sp. 007]|uniref:hypothetical protein n=1 Tax=Rhizobium sp. 007 TaxID=2785056 RepID=UPI00188E6469|nr:hypothetical protein [Rhizobium sp. 007]QPB24744.1 hypothetical protein ISN39_35355 [Rhizobium sp. 007]